MLPVRGQTPGSANDVPYSLPRQDSIINKMVNNQEHCRSVYHIVFIERVSPNEYCAPA